MVLDNVKNLSLYKSLLGDSIEAIENFLKEYGASPKENGTYFLDGADGSKLRANVSRYETKSAEGSFLEAHKKYIDIQLIAEGEENIGWANLNDNFTPTEKFDDAKDIGFYKDDCDTFVTVKAGNFVILLPEDAHMPCISTTDKPTPVTKILFKVLCE